MKYSRLESEGANSIFSAEESSEKTKELYQVNLDAK